MAQTFRHNVADGRIYIDNNTGVESGYPYSWWITQESAYTFPDGAAFVMYTEGGVSGQSYYIKNGNQYALPLDPWPAADAYIAKQTVYDADYATYIGTPTTLAQAQAQKIVQLATEMSEIRQGNVLFTPDDTQYTFDSGIVHYARLKEERDYADYLTDVPEGYYVNDTTSPISVEVSFTYTNLKDLVALIENLYYLCYLNYDEHYAAIQALTTIVAVQAYDVTTGWPTTPFSG
jgi:hypothetical protein